MANRMKICTFAVALSLRKAFIRAVASMRPNAAAIEVFLTSAIITLASGGTTARTRRGGTTVVIDLVNVSPMAREASACPIGTEFTPERIASHTNAEVYTVSATTALRKKL